MSGFFYIGSGALLFASIYTTCTGGVNESLIWGIWGASLIIKDAIEKNKRVI